MTALQEIQDAVTSVAERVGPAVVAVGHDWARGAGVVVAPDRVLTAAHHLRGPEPTVVFADGRRAAARVVGADPDADLAVLAVDTGGAPSVRWPDAGAPVDVALGSAVFGVSNPGGRGLRVTAGFVSAVRPDTGPSGPRHRNRRRTVGGLEHTAALGRGSSGSPLVDADGRLVGLNRSRLGDGLTLAAPATPELRAAVDALGRGETPRRPRLGVAVAPGFVAQRLRRAVGLPDHDGVLVRALLSDGPAAAAGIAEGDLIIQVADRPITDASEIASVLAGLDAPNVDVVVLRGTEERTVTVTLPHDPAATARS